MSNKVATISAANLKLIDSFFLGGGGWKIYFKSWIFLSRLAITDL